MEREEIERGDRELRDGMYSLDAQT